MTVQTFEYCSLQYLNQWFNNDRGYCEDLSNDNQETKRSALERAAVFYKVARNLPLKFEKGLKRYQPVLEILDLVCKEQFNNDNPVKEIVEIRNRISRKYGNRNVSSLTTKFLWLKIKQPILIYDSRARNALRSNDDLVDFYNKWKESFEKHKKYIEKACSCLPELHLYVEREDNVAATAATKEDIKILSNEAWFQERVFDTYLWNIGKND